MKNVKFIAFITAAVLIVTSCSKDRECYDTNGRPINCTGSTGGGTNNTTTYSWWNGPLPFSLTNTIQVRVMDDKLTEKQNYPRPYSLLVDIGLDHYIDMIFGGPVHDYVWIQARMNYGGQYYWVKFVTQSPSSLKNDDVITVTISSDQASPFAFVVNSYQDFNNTYYDGTGGMPTINKGTSTNLSPLYNSEGVYAHN